MRVVGWLLGWVTVGMAVAVAVSKACQLPADMDRLSPQIRHQLSPDDFARMWDDIVHNY